MAQKEAATNKDEILELTTKQIEKKFGKGAIMKLGDNEYQKVDVIRCYGNH